MYPEDFTLEEHKEEVFASIYAFPMENPQIMDALLMLTHLSHHNPTCFKVIFITAGLLNHMSPHLK